MTEPDDKPKIDPDDIDGRVLGDLSVDELLALREELRHHRGWINNRLNTIKLRLEEKRVGGADE